MIQAFVSYSRVQFYFAESLARGLMQEDISVWFDIFRLKPGCDWNAGIHQGLEESQVLVLVGSRDALCSDNVADELKAAQAANKPIYIALFEAIDLPDDLRKASVIDFRGNFSKALERLAECLELGRSVHDRLPATSPGHIPTRLPTTLWLIALLLLGIGVCTVPGLVLASAVLDAQVRGVSDVLDIGLWFNLPMIAAAAIMLLALGSWCLVQLWTFLHRSFNHTALRYSLLFSTFMALIVLLITGPFPIVHVPLLLALNLYMLILMVGTFVAYLRLDSSLALLRWLPTGEAPESLHARIGAVPSLHHTSTDKSISSSVMPADTSFATAMAALRGPGQGSSVQRCFQLHYALSDQRVADDLIGALNRAGYRKTNNDDAELHVAILSSNTPRELLSTLDHLPGSPIRLNVIASSIVVPQESEAVGKYQWFDYRSRSNWQLVELGSYLRNPERTGSTFNTNAVPVKTSRIITPTRITIAATVLRIVGTLMLANVIAANLSIRQIGGETVISNVVNSTLIGNLGNFHIHPEYFWPIMNAILILEVVLGMGLNWLAVALLNRQVTPRLFTGIALAGGLLMLYDFPHGLLIDVLLIGLFLWSYKQVVDWLPVVPPHSDGPTLALPNWWVAWRGNLLILVVVMLYIFANPLNGV